MYCIYHSQDLDGRCSGAIVKYFNPECKMFPYDNGREFPYNKFPENDVVYMVDISIPIKNMVEFAKNRQLVWIDHHISSIEDAKSHKFNPKGIRKTEQAACELTWQFFSKKDIPLGIKLLGRYDVWDSNYSKDLVPLQLGCNACENSPDLKKSMKFWKKIIEDESFVQQLIANGEIIKPFIDLQNKRLVKSYSFLTELDGLKALAINKQPANSYIFESLWDNKKYDIMIAFCRVGNSFWKVSLYTDKPGIDVSKIAAKYNGGGHVKASGFVCSNLPFRI